MTASEKNLILLKFRASDSIVIVGESEKDNVGHKEGEKWREKGKKTAETENGEKDKENKVQGCKQRAES